MTPSVQEIETAVSQLTPDQLADFRAWFTEFEAQHWDRQFETDAQTGRLDALAAEALGDYRAGRTTER